MDEENRGGLEFSGCLCAASVPWSTGGRSGRVRPSASDSESRRYTNCAKPSGKENPMFESNFEVGGMNSVVGISRNRY